MTTQIDAAQTTKLSRAEYLKQYRQKNRDRINAYDREYRNTHQKQRAVAMLKYWTKKLAEIEAEEGQKQ